MFRNQTLLVNYKCVSLITQLSYYYIRLTVEDGGFSFFFFTVLILGNNEIIFLFKKKTLMYSPLHNLQDF